VYQVGKEIKRTTLKSHISTQLVRNEVSVWDISFVMLVVLERM